MVVEERKPEPSAVSEREQEPAERKAAVTSPTDIKAAVGPDYQDYEQLAKQFGLEEGLEDLDIENLDEILECSDDLMDIE